MNEHIPAPGQFQSDLLTADDIATLLRVRITTVYQWSSGVRNPPPGFPAPLHIGKRVRWRADEVRQWLEACRHAEPPAKRGRGRPRKLFVFQSAANAG